MESRQMHDWTLIAVRVDWGSGCVQLDMRSKPGELGRVVARDFRKVEVPRRQEWGESGSVMSHVGPEQYDADLRRLSILMQSGDSREIEMPVAS